MKAGFAWILLCLAVSIATGQGRGTQNKFHVPGYPPIEETLDIENWFGNTYILFKTYRTNWMKAHIKCRTHGMEMLTVDSRSEFDFISNALLDSDLLKEALKTQPTNPYLPWLGIHDLFNEGNFTNLYTGKPFPNGEFYNANNQPDNGGGNEHCGHIWFFNNETPNTMTINDNGCGGSLPVACKLNAYNY